MPTAASPPSEGHRPLGRHRWLEPLVAGRTVIVVGEVDDELLLGLRGAGAVRIEFVSTMELQEDALPGHLGAHFDVVLVTVDEQGDGRELHDAASMSAPTATIVAVLRTPQAPATVSNGATGEGREHDALRGTIERLEARRAAVLRELVTCEQALSRSEEFAETVHEEILLMRRTVSWRITRPLRWIRSRAGHR